MNAAWLVLLMSAALEAVWATALGQSNGFTEPVPTVVFLVAGTLSIGGLGIAMKRLPISIAYAVWTGLGAALTVSYAMLTGEERFSVVKVLLLAGLLGCVIGLKLVGTREADDDSGAAAMTKTPE